MIEWQSIVLFFFVSIMMLTFNVILNLFTSPLSQNAKLGFSFFTLVLGAIFFTSGYFLETEFPEAFKEEAGNVANFINALHLLGFYFLGYSITSLYSNYQRLNVQQVDSNQPFYNLFHVKVVNSLVNLITSICMVNVISYIYPLEILLSTGFAVFMIAIVAKDAALNFISGFMIINTKQIQVGSVLSIDDYQGQVIDIDSSSIVIEDNKKSKTYIPHHYLLNHPHTVHNKFEAKPYCEFPITLPKIMSPKDAESLIMLVAKSCLDIDTAKNCRVKIKELQEKNIIYLLEIQNYIDHQNELKDKFMRVMYYKMARKFQPDSLDYIESANELFIPRMSESTIRQSLASFSAFSKFSEPSMDYLVTNAEVNCYGKDEIIIFPKRVNQTLFFIYQGVLQINHITEDNQEIELARVSAGELIGEFGVLLEEQSNCLVRVLEEATLIEITRSAFKHIVTEEEGVFEILYEMITERKAYNEDKIATSQNEAKEKVTVDKESALFKSLKRILG